MEESVGLKWCALVDPAAHPELPGLLWEFRGDEEICPLFMNTMLSEVSLGGPLFTVLQPFGKITEWFLSNAEMSAVGVLYAVPEGRENALSSISRTCWKHLCPRWDRAVRFLRPPCPACRTSLP